MRIRVESSAEADMLRDLEVVASDPNFARPS